MSEFDISRRLTDDEIREVFLSPMVAMTESNAAIALRFEVTRARREEDSLRLALETATRERDEARAALEKSRRTLVFTYRDVLACTENMSVPADVRGVNLHDLVLGLLQDRADARAERDSALARLVPPPADAATGEGR